MTITATLGLRCPDPDDMGALALYLQDLAYDLDAQLQAMRNALLGVTNRPTAIWTKAGGMTLSGLTTADVAWDTVVFANYANALVGVEAQLPQGVGGWWRIGAWFRAIQAAAIITTQTRVLSVNIGHDPIDSIFATAGDGTNMPSGFGDATLESNTNNGENCLCEGLVLVPAFAGRPAGFAVSVGNGNTGGGGNVTVDPLIGWATFVGAGDLVEVT